MKRAEHQPFSELTLYAGIYLRTWVVADRGTMLPQHAHVWDHISFVVSGVVRIWRGDELLGDFAGPHAVKIAAREKHRFLTLSDRVTIACIHAVGEAEDVDIAEEHQLELED
jgi:quercetin dioxygenase-like cupin family protein